MCVKMVARPDLPEEILIDIFSRLPAKSVGKCRCLSKQWLNLLSTSHFIKSHLALQNTRQQSLILIPPSSVIRCVETVSGEHDDTVSRQLNLPGLWSEFMGSCDGLVLLKNNNGEVFLVNPITLELSKIPDPPNVAIKTIEGFYGFGYDGVGDDYKVVAVSYQTSYDKMYDMIYPIYIDTLVYYVKKGVWKKIESLPRHYSQLINFSGTFFNGSIHWLVRKSKDCVVIAALDLDSELFFEIPAPSVAGVSNLFFCSLSVRGGCLCVVDTRSNSEGTDIWIMKDYGVAESWSKITFTGCCGEFIQPFYFIGGGKDEVVLFITDMRLVVYNVKEGATRDMIVDRVPGTFANGGTFVGSLVSPLNP